MDNDKKVITISLNKFLLLLFIFIILVAGVVFLCINQFKKNISINGREASAVEMKDKKFIITDIDNKDGEYKVKAEVLGEEKKVISQEEYSKIINGELLKFRGLDWKYDNSNKDNKEYVYSGIYVLQIKNDQKTGDYYLDNASSNNTRNNGLADFSGEKIEFTVDEIDDYLLNNYQDIYTDSEGECTANVKDGEVESVDLVNKDNDMITDDNKTESTNKQIKYEDYIGIWQFRCENEHLVELNIKEIEDGKITYEVYAYRNETYGESTSEFGYDSASIAPFDVEKEGSVISGIIELQDGKVGLRIQSATEQEIFKDDEYYESVGKIKYEDYVGIWQFRCENDSLVELNIKGIEDGKITYEVYAYRNETYGESTSEFGYDSASIAPFDVEKEGSVISGIIELQDGKVGLRIQSATEQEIFKDDEYYESVGKIKYEDYVGIWQFRCENDSLVELNIKGIEDGKITYEVYAYRNETYGESTSEFGYDSASIAPFDVEKEGSVISGIIELQDGKVGLRIQSATEQEIFKDDEYYESVGKIKYEDYVGIWQFRCENDSLVELNIKGIEDGKITYEVYAYRNETYGESTSEFGYDSASIAPFDVEKEGSVISGIIELQDGKVGLRIQSATEQEIFKDDEYYESVGKIKYEDYVGIWQFRCENDSLVELNIKGIEDGKITYEVYAYRNETYGESTSEFGYDSASIAPFDVEKEGSVINGIIELQDSKVGLKIQSATEQGIFKDDGYYESYI